jgi:CubicO group peptidase (beta-lactamase class C family)
MRVKAAFATLLACLLLSAVAVADPLPTTAPETVGLSSQRLDRLSAALRAEIDNGTIPGAVLLISKQNKIAYFEAMGSLDPQTKVPMSKEAIFRIYSMSKPITTVTAMMLLEQGRLALNDPLAKYLPEFKDVKVGEEKRDAAGAVTLALVAPKRAITIQDLMRHTSGLTYGFFGGGAVKKAYQEANFYENNPTTAEFVARLAKMPLAYQPGTTWDYSQSTDVLGRIIEVVTGKSLLQACKEMLLDPLGMTDTAFYVTDAAKQPRIAEPFAKDRTIGVNATFNDPRVALNYESGGGGMVGTAMDYARFLQMLLNGGQLDGHRYLSPRTIAYMTSDQLGDAIRPGPYDLLGPGYRFGLGFAVRMSTGVAPYPGSAGDFHWAGAGGTAFWVDPKEKMFVVFMMQSPSKRSQLRYLLRDMVYAAVID